ncbi:hypothetical protein CC117_17525 [Parafrankia colletiae]|uniref:Uncharacterized protein n=1 Tax=Parafrankia colletiae TaxID=573497 RepID=A0A1S1QTD0_9ACTN|nr:hypothetical protein [Parafrankia colletiae]MCK9904323.1 hypothetical protein [Frankia sp. Cpl3]OHV36691.1 hypothetical protein CC117_17525 [Parafrankia colletiae]
MSNVKCALALMGGYVLGRTKKGKAAIGLGLWVSGHNYHAKDVLRDQAVRLLHSEEGGQLISQIRGPAAEAGRRAAVAVYESQLDRLSQALAGRTERLTAALGDTAKTVEEGGGAAGKAVGSVLGSAASGTRSDHSGQGETGTDQATDQRDTDERDEDDGSGSETGSAAGRQVPGRSAGRRREARRGPLEQLAQASSGGGSR